MRLRVQFLALILAALAGNSAAADEMTELKKVHNELRDVELKIEESTRFLPPSFDAAVEEKFVRSMARQAKLEIEVRALPDSENIPLDRGEPSPMDLYRMEISGRGELEKLSYFLTLMAARDFRFADLETLHLEAAPGDSVRFRGRYLLPCFIGPIELPSRPIPRGGILAYARERLVRSRAVLELFEAWTERFKSGRLAGAAALLEATTEQKAMRMTAVRVDDQVLVEGVLVGAAARAGFLTSLEKAGFHVSRLRLSPLGACRPFSIIARRGMSGPPMELVLDKTLLDSPTGALCRRESQRSVGRVVARATSSVAADTGALSLKLRDIDLADVFFVLHDLTGESFVIDPDVKGVVNVDVEGATLEKTLAAMSSAGVIVSPGPLHRVSPAGRTAAPLRSQKYDGDPVNLSMQEVDLPSLLCLFKQITGLEIHVPQTVQSRVAVFAREVPWDHVLEMVIASAGFDYAIDQNRMFVGPEAAVKNRARRPGVDACTARNTPSGSSLQEMAMTLQQLGAPDLELAGVGRAGEKWKAYAYGPWRRLLFPVEADQPLFDARVTSVGPTGVAFSTDSAGIFEIPLKP
jgi:hypothetical protein